MLNRISLPPKTQKELAKILALDLSSLIPSQLAFLNARRDYLTSDEKEAFKIGVEELKPKPKSKKKKK